MLQGLKYLHIIAIYKYFVKLIEHCSHELDVGSIWYICYLLVHNSNAL